MNLLSAKLVFSRIKSKSFSALMSMSHKNRNRQTHDWGGDSWKVLLNVAELESPKDDCAYLMTLAVVVLPSL